MNKIKYVFGLLLFTLFLPKVNALSYELGTTVTSTSVNQYEIELSLKNIKDTSYGIAGCTMNINLTNNGKLNNKVRSLGSWSMLNDALYLFDTASPALKNTSFAIVPVIVTGDTTVTLSNITCSDGEVDVEIEDKVVNLEYTSTSSNNNKNNNNGQNNEDMTDSNCDLSDIILSEGTIEFDSNVTEYEIEVSDINTLMVEPVPSSNKATYNVTNSEDTIIIDVEAVDGSSKRYTLYIREKTEEETPTENKTDYTPIFIGIICILVLINIYRIVKNKRVKN